MERQMRGLGRGLAADPVLARSYYERAAAIGGPTEEAALESPWGYLLLRQRPDTRILGAGSALRPMRAEFDLLDSP